MADSKTHHFGYSSSDPVYLLLSSSYYQVDVLNWAGSKQAGNVLEEAQIEGSTLATAFQNLEHFVESSWEINHRLVPLRNPQLVEQKNWAALGRAGKE